MDVLEKIANNIMTSTITRYHRNLSNYFMKQPLFFDSDLQKKPNIRKCMEQPWQQTKAELWDEVTHTLCNLDFIQAKAAAKKTYELINDFNEVLEVIPDNAENIRKEKARQERMDKYTRDLIACAKGEITLDELDIPESIRPWTKERLDAENEWVKLVQYRSDRLICFRQFLGKEAANLQEYAHEIPGLAVQQAWNFTADGPVGSLASHVPAKKLSPLFLHTQPFRKIWDPHPPALRTLKGHCHWILGTDITPDGRKGISVSLDESCIVWDLGTSQPIRKFQGLSPAPVRIWMTPTGKLALADSGKKSFLLDLENGAVLRTFNGNYTSISPDGKKSLLISDQGSLVLFDLVNAAPICAIEAGNQVVTVSLTPASSGIIAVTADNQFKQFDAKSGDLISSFFFQGKNKIRSVSVTPDGNLALLLFHKDQSCQLFDLKKSVLARTLSGYRSTILSAVITHDGKLALTSHEDKTCILWDTGTGEPLKTIRGHSETITELAITPDGKFAFAGSFDSTCILLDLEASSMESPTEMKGSLWGKLKNEIIPPGDPLLKIRNKTDLHPVYAITPDKNHAIVAVTNTGRCFVWNLKTGEPVHELKGHSNSILSIQTTPDGKLALTTSLDSTCRLWHIVKGILLRTFETKPDQAQKIALSPDGKTLYSISSNLLVLRDLITGNLTGSFAGDFGSVKSASVTKNGKYLFTASFEGKFILWNLDTLDKAAVLIPGEGIHDYIFQDFRLLVCGNSGDATILTVPEFCQVPPKIVTLEQIGIFQKDEIHESAFECPYCGKKSEPPISVLNTIGKITKKAGLKPPQSPCLELPDEAWDEPGLLVECPGCKEKLKFNPFIAGDDENHKIWMFWKK